MYELLSTCVFSSLLSTLKKVESYSQRNPPNPKGLYSYPPRDSDKTNRKIQRKNIPNAVFLKLEDPPSPLERTVEQICTIDFEKAIFSKYNQM